MAGKKSQKPRKTSPASAATKPTVIALKPKKDASTTPEQEPTPEGTEPATSVSEIAQASASANPSESATTSKPTNVGEFANTSEPAKTPKTANVVEPPKAPKTPKLAEPPKASKTAQLAEPTQAPEPAKTTKLTKPVKPIPSPQTPVLDALPSAPVAEGQIPSSEATSDSPPDHAIFQAVGIIVGDVHFNEEGMGFITIGEKPYRLFYSSTHKRSCYALKREIEQTQQHKQRLLVYPRVTHFPKREQPHTISFQLVGFESAQKSFLNHIDLADFEFKLSGLWQFIPVCSTPCLSIFKNFSSERLTYIKEAAVESKVNFMKASHIPVIWRDAPVKPFRFNPKLDKENQGQASFLGIKAKFLPEKDVFSFCELCLSPSRPPKFLKAGKKDKTQAIKSKQKRMNKKPTETP